MLNILIFNWRDIEHPWAGGAERHIHELAKYWINKGNCRVTLVCGGFKGAQHKEVIDSVKIIRLGNTYSIFLLSGIYYLIRLRWKKFDIVIDTAHGLPFFTPFFTRRKKILIIHHDHTRLWRSEWKGMVGRIGSVIESRLVSFIYKNIPVVTLSDSSKKELMKKGYKKVYAVPPGIDTAFYNGLHNKSQTPLVLYLGRLRKYKRVDMLLYMMPFICDEIPNTKLIIAGNGQDRARIFEIIREKKLNNRVIFKGYISEEEKRELLSQAWVLAFPSLIEGWGLVAMEAAASGTPTVGFRVPGVEDAINDGYSGILVDTKPEFESAVVKILKDKNLRTRLGENGKLWAAKFTWEKSADKFLEIISKGL
jgi:glycosyltransferase involved in cell wall biosynthesis